MVTAVLEEKLPKQALSPKSQFSSQTKQYVKQNTLLFSETGDHKLIHKPLLTPAEIILYGNVCQQMDEKLRAQIMKTKQNNYKKAKTTWCAKA